MTVCGKVSSSSSSVESGPRMSLFKTQPYLSVGLEVSGTGWSLDGHMIVADVNAAVP